MPQVKAKPKGKGGSTAQSVRFDKEKWSKAEAVKWCREHKYITSGYDETENQHRFRQFNPNLCSGSGVMLTKNLPDGVQIYACKPKKSAIKESIELLESIGEAIKKIVHLGRERNVFQK